MKSGIINNNPVALGNKTAKAETATAYSAGGLCLSSPHHSIAALGSPRGLRNNNPLNLRCGSCPWEGKAQKNTDGKFEQFVSMYYGFLAAILTIEAFIIEYQCNTIRQIISRWAPPNEGYDTSQYINIICCLTGIGGNEPLSNHDPRLKIIVAAMARIESGEEIQDYFKFLEHAFDDFSPKEIYENYKPRRYR